MKKILLFLFIGLVFGSQLRAQNSFSTDREVFFSQATQRLKSLGTEPANKVAFDFENAWRTKFTTEHKDKIHQIAIAMERRGLIFQPDFWYFFSYLAFSTEQAGMQSAELSKLLEINEQVVKTMETGRYRNFLFGLNIYLARRYLTLTKLVAVQTAEGTYEFELLDAYVAPEEEVEMVDKEEIIDVPEDIVQGESYYTEPAPDPWGSDPWGADPWAAPATDNGTTETDSWGEEPTEELIDSNARPVIMGIAENYIATQLARYSPPPAEGPILKMENNALVISTPYDSLMLKEFDGTFLLQSRQLLGKNGLLNWPNSPYGEMVVTLKEFYIPKDRSDFITPHASISAPSLFVGTADGLFEFKSIRRKKGQKSTFPVFTSNQSDLNVKIGDGINYTGGVKIVGDQLYGTSVSKVPGKVEVLDGRGNRLVFHSTFFSFKDSVITSDNATFLLLHQSDSLYHRGVNLRYDIKKKQLSAYRIKKFNTLPYESSFFQMEFNADVLRWDLNTDSIDFSILNGQDLVPASFESSQYYNSIRFQRLASGFHFNPVSTFVFYARKFRIETFNSEELVTEFKLTSKQAYGAATLLARFGFIDFDPQTNQVTMREKAYHYYDASGGKVDYDNLMIPSLSPGRPNGTFRLDSGQLVVRGVREFFFTSDFQVSAQPEKGILTILQNRGIRMNGVIEAGDFHYTGHNFQFDYDAFLVEMEKIDSIRIMLHDSIDENGEHASLPNELTQTAGTLYLDDPTNRSGVIDSESYPFFNSSSDAIVFFDRPEVLNGAYDKSVKFIIPPFEEDSLDVDAAISFGGKFNSGGIFPEFEETLRIMPDKSLGFIHQIPQEGYNLYGTAAKTYKKISLSNDGLRGGGKIDFITSTLYSDDFVYYPDSVAAFGYQGFIGAGEVGKASYPEAVLGPFRMHWLPRIDSMYLNNLQEPFKFYNATATLDGAIDITTRGVFGSGTMLTRGSKSVSEDLTFKQYSYSARHAKFSVLTDNPAKPAMAGDDIRLNFDLNRNIADIHPEKEGVAAISFPYAQMKTSITNAQWYLEDSVVTMTKPDEVPIEKSYFYSTRKELDSLSFNASEASYDFNTKELNVRGIPYIIVADAKIIPWGNETTILENSELQTFENAQIIIDTLNGYHHLKDGNIKITNRNEFVGNATYDLVTGIDTFDIRFDSFVLEEVYLTPKKKRLMTVSGGEVLAKENLLIAPGFFYKGKVKMFAYKKALELDGLVKLNLKSPTYDYWVQFERKNEDPEVKIDFSTAYLEDEEQPVAGLQYDLRGTLYTTFVEKRKSPSDEDFFFPKGTLSFDPESGSYQIDNPKKAAGESYEGHTMIYNDSTGAVVFEGPVNFFSPFVQKVKVAGSVLGQGNRFTNEYQVDALITLDFPGIQLQTDVMAADLIDIISRLGSPPANDISLELLYKFANLTSDAVARSYETNSLKEYLPLVNASEVLWKSIVISGVKMTWSESNKSWYNTTKLAISNINRKDVNAKLDGFLEIKKDGSNNDVLNLFIQAAPGTWYFISYNTDNLLFYSSNKAFNEAISAKSNFGTAKPGELVTLLGEENDVLGFVNGFLETYFGVTEPYNLVYPDETNLEDENFDTIEKKDDGFGF